MLARSLRIFDSKSSALARRLSAKSNVEITEEVRNALNNRQAVVALESTIITHGMPYPDNVKCALEVEEIVRSRGAVPATIAIKNGTVKVGLSECDLNELGDTNFSKPVKTSRRDFAYVISSKRNGGTTVCGTLIVADRVNIPIFATGGIGGVHREAQSTLDISADLQELGRTSVAVVSSGVKSILDIPKTLEYLETQGVFVATFGPTKDFPAFYSIKSGCTAPYNVPNASEAAALIKSSRDFKLKSGILLAVPIPHEHALDFEEVNRVIDRAVEEAKKKNVRGKEITPFLLAEISRMTEGKSLKSNVALVKNNARIAADIAVELASPVKSEKCVEKRPIIIGGSNIDSNAVLDTDEIKLDGRLYKTQFSFTPGGVGRNMCEALHKLGCSPDFLTVVGEDYFGGQVTESIPAASRRLLRTSGGKGTAQCNIVFDKVGNCQMLMGDMEVHEEITRQTVADNEDVIRKSPLIILESNLSLDAIDAVLRVADKYGIPVLYEPTDAAVATKAFKSEFHRAIKLMCPNVNELKEIANFLNIRQSSSSSIEDIAELSKKLVQYVDNVLVTLGPKGVLIARKGSVSDSFWCKLSEKNIQVRHYPAPLVTDIINVSGAGDCFISGFVAASLSNKPEDICVSVGIAAANLALKVKKTVPDSMFDESHVSWNKPAVYKTLE